MFEYSQYFDGLKEWKLCNINPVDAKIYYEGKKPYIDYIGEAIGLDGMKVTVHIPKISLSFKEFNYKEKIDFCNGVFLNFKMEAFATQDEDILFTIMEREMTKEQIDAMAGCKVKIVGD